MTGDAVGVLDYGSGNLHSLENALAHLGLPFVRLAGGDSLAGVRRLVLPGVGHFGHAAARLRESGLDRALASYAASGGRLLGICLGMQLMFEGSDEAEGARGLGLLPGRSVAFLEPSLKALHMGWSRIDFEPGPRRADAYFVHQYCIRDWSSPARPDLLGTASYGGEFVAAFRAGNLAGCQFHPEKSGPWGLSFLEELLSWS
jgi:imidazole glycerol-phosphate synthase subunit HisH